MYNLHRLIARTNELTGLQLAQNRSMIIADRAPRVDDDEACGNKSWVDVQHGKVWINLNDAWVCLYSAPRIYYPHAEVIWSVIQSLV